MKIALITDLHFGIKNDLNIIKSYKKKFFDNIFFPYLEKNNIKTIIDLGDFFDRRKFVNYETLNWVRTNYLKKLENYSYYQILGNHDCYYKNSNSVNGPTEILSKYSNIKILDKFEDIEIAGKSFAIFPWISDENKQEFLNFARSSKSTIALGHFEINGYEVSRGIKHEGWLDQNILDSFEIVMSGHFHKKQAKNNVMYLGTAYELDFSDVDEIKGFHVFDTETHNLEYIKNPYKLFYKIDYTDSYTETDLSKYKDSYVKIVIKNKINPIKYETFLDSLYNIGPYEVNIIDENDLFINTEDSKIDQSLNTIEIISKDIDTLPDIENKEKLKNIMNELYTESFDIED